jgi:hypothetical protein
VLRVHPVRVAIVIALVAGCSPNVMESPNATPDAAADSATTTTPCAAIAETADVRLCSVRRAPENPLITPTTHTGISGNITMPTVIKAPPALATANGFGAYWMYFAAHDGHYIRLAHAPSVAGPWTNYTPGTLKDTEVAPFSNTISSPDVLVLPDGRIRMYFSCDSYPGSTEQWSGVADSADGIHFSLASTQNIAKYYMRVFEWEGTKYAVQKGWSTAPAELGASPDGVARFAFIKTFSGGSIRHMAVLVDHEAMLVFYSKIGDAPERILLSTIRLDQGTPDTWDLSPPVEVLRPELPYEGSDYPIAPSVKGPATKVNQLRDPYIFVDGGKTYMFYGIAGESGIALAEIDYQLK